jgi:hypothetical protein
LRLITDRGSGDITIQADRNSGKSPLPWLDVKRYVLRASMVFDFGNNFPLLGKTESPRGVYCIPVNAPRLCKHPVFSAVLHLRACQITDENCFDRHIKIKGARMALAFQ